jgi:putative FmdB family regulatory protein
MPIYEYVCPNCGQPFEKLVRGGRKAREKPMPCPHCGHDSYRKKVTLVAAVGASDSKSLASSAAACAPSG